MRHPYTPIDYPRVLRHLKNPRQEFNKKIIIDTDAYNSIDDQFALMHMLLSEKNRGDVSILGITAAPFYKELRNTDSYKHGMELSYQEIINVINTLAFKWNGLVKKGSVISLDETNCIPVESDAADFICEVSRSHKEDEFPIYILALGSLTNVASAILKDPHIINNLVVCTLGGVPFDFYGFKDFNYQQDINAANFVFSCGIPIVHFPTFTVTEQLRTSRWELEAHIGNSKSGKFLYNRFIEFVDEYPGSNKQIWDLAPGAWIINPDWFISKINKTKKFTFDNVWKTSPETHPLRSILWLDRDSIFRDFFTLINN